MSEKIKNTYNPFDDGQIDLDEVARRIVHIIDTEPPFMSPENLKELEKGLRTAEEIVALVRLPTDTLPN